MSYILEALKKSEQERGHGDTPSVQTIHSSGLQYTQQDKPVWPYILAGVITLNVAALIYFLIPVAGLPAHNNVENADIIVGSNKISTNIAPQVTPQASTHSPSRASTQQQVTNNSPEPATPLGQTTATQTVRDEYATTSLPPRTVQTAQAEPVTNRSSRDTSVKKSAVADLQDLPADVQSAIPEIIFSAHVYSSNPVQRSVVINGDFMEEGDALNSRLTLDEITNDGVIFDYEGIRFHSSVLSGWSTR